MVIMSDAESFGLKFACFVLALALIIIILIKPSPNNSIQASTPIYDTIVVHDTLTVHDTIRYSYPQKRETPKPTKTETTESYGDYDEIE